MNAVARLNATPVRLAFVLAAATAALILFFGQREQLVAATRQVGFGTVALSLCLAFLNLAFAAASWRVVARDLGLRPTRSQAARIYFLGQIGKYLPGGIWNFVASAELGHDAGLTRKATLASFVLSLLIGLTSGAALAIALLPMAGIAADQQRWAVLAAFACPTLLLIPAVRGYLLRLARVDSASRGSFGGTFLALVLATGGWLVAGAQIWVLLGAIGAGGSGPADIPIAIGSYALAWVTGFLVMVAPAGLGAREATLTAALATIASPAEALVVALLARLVTTAADLFAAGATLLIARR